jgi:hypothetical protein
LKLLACLELYEVTGADKTLTHIALAKFRATNSVETVAYGVSMED